MRSYVMLFPLLLLGIIVLSSKPRVQKIPASGVHKFQASQLQQEFNDGPYIIFRNDSIISLNIVNGEIVQEVLNPESVQTTFEAAPSAYENIARIAVLSDVHGQYELTTTILKNNGIIDASLNWNYGDGHFVIVGDIFDRGDKVTELLWLVYKLEQQAEAAGGKVHFTLGNHEYMVLLNDLRYIHRKYRITQQLLQMPLDQLYNQQSLLGRWLRSKNTILKIDNNLFVHGGISTEFMANGYDIDQINASMRRSLDDTLSKTVRDSLYRPYYYSMGPIWYRGYFTDSLKIREIKKLLRNLDVDQIIVGHTSQDRIQSLHKNKIYAVDTSIKNGMNGELLFIENGKFYRGTMEGNKEPIN